MTVNAALPGWTTRNIFEGQSYSFLESNTAWREIVAPKACFLMCTGTDAIIRYRPNNPGGGNSVYGVSTQGRVMLPVPGVWYIQLVESSGGAQTRTLFLMDYAMLSGAADALAGVAGMDLTSINGTTQTGLNLTARYLPFSTPAGQAAITVNAADTAIFSANTSRKYMMLLNRSTGGQDVGFWIGTATALGGTGMFLVLPAGAGYIYQQPHEPPPTGIIRAWASAAGATVYASEGT